MPVTTINSPRWGSSILTTSRRSSAFDLPFDAFAAMPGPRESSVVEGFGAEQTLADQERRWAQRVVGDAQRALGQRQDVLVPVGPCDEHPHLLDHIVRRMPHRY